MRLRDIADKLREVHPDMVMAIDFQYIPIGQLAHEAADEIERLKKLVECQKEQLDARDH